MPLAGPSQHRAPFRPMLVRRWVLAFASGANGAAGPVAPQHRHAVRESRKEKGGTGC